MAHLFITALSAFVAAVVLTWLVRRAALALGVMDRPDGIRKLHRQPIPLLGGVGVFGAWLIGIITCLALERGSSLVTAAWSDVVGDYSPLTTHHSPDPPLSFHAPLFSSAPVLLVSVVLL